MEALYRSRVGWCISLPFPGDEGALLRLLGLLGVLLVSSILAVLLAIAACTSSSASAGTVLRVSAVPLLLLPLGLAVLAVRVVWRLGRLTVGLLSARDEWLLAPRAELVCPRVEAALLT